jgi:glycosyl hydrolase family 123
MKPVLRPLGLIFALASPALGAPSDPWWDQAWPYRIEVDASGSGVVSASIDFGAALTGLGLNNAILDLRSVRVVPAGAAAAVPHAETYSVLIEDAENPQFTDGSGVSWTVNDGNALRDPTRASQGASSVKAVVVNDPNGYGYPGVEFHIASTDPRHNWSRFETFLYDVWPEVNASAVDQAPDLYSYKLYGACAGNSVTQGGPPLALDRWNRVSVSLRPLGSCWPQDGLDLSNVTRMEFFTTDNSTVPGNSGLWDDGDVLTLWFDNLRLVDQNTGTLRWQAAPGTGRYFVYFDVLTHEGHPPATLATNLGSPNVNGSLGPAEAGGYYHRVQGTTGGAGLTIWSAPTIEKILPTVSAPVATAPLRVKAARGEFEPFQLVVRSPSNQNLAVNATALTNGGSTVPAPRIHRVDYVNVTTAGDHFDRFGKWPDPLWPLNPGEAVSFPAGQEQPLWFTLQVPWNAPAGTYRGNVTIGGATVPVELTVWDFTMPRQIHLDSEWGFDWSQIVDIYHGTRDGNVDPCYWPLVDGFKQDFIDHRLIPKGVAWPAGLNYPGGIDFDCNNGVLSPDDGGEWDFATIGGRVIHGENGFNGGVGFPAFLALGPWSNDAFDSLPYTFCGVNRSGALGSTEYRAKLGSYLSALDAYIVSAGYANAAYYHIVNEPQTDQDYTITGQISGFVHSKSPHLRQLLSEQVEPAVYNYPGAKIDIWMPTISNYEPVKSHDRQKNHGEQVWWYYLYGDDPPLPNPILMSHPGIEARVTPWLAWAERVDGLLHYSASDWDENPWTTPNVTGLDNGDAFFFYPPRKDNQPLATCGQNGNRLVPSIRWENLRDGMEDYEYLWLLGGGKPPVNGSSAADPYVARLVQSRTLFSHVPTDLDAAREAVAAALTAPKGPVPSGGALVPAALMALAALLRARRRRGRP